LVVSRADLRENKAGHVRSAIHALAYWALKSHDSNQGDNGDLNCRFDRSAKALGLAKQPS
jgi:hypothetical protein